MLFRSENPEQIIRTDHEASLGLFPKQASKLSLGVAEEKMLALENKASLKVSDKDAPKKTDAEEIVDTISKRYNRISHFYGEFDSDDVLEIYLTSLAHVYDPHTDYFNPRQAEDFSIGMNLSLFGIGAVLSSEDGYCKISDLKPGPAFKSKRFMPIEKSSA